MSVPAIAFYLGLLANLILGLAIKRFPSLSTIILLIFIMEGIVLGVALPIDAFLLPVMSEDTARYVTAAGGIAVAVICGHAFVREWKRASKG